MGQRDYATVGELAAQDPSATRVLDRYGIDYSYAGRSRTVREACESAGVPVDDLERALAAEAARRPASAPSWLTAPLADVVDHVVRDHHTFARVEVDRALELARRAAKAPGPLQSELEAIVEVLATLKIDLLAHMVREERTLFPHVVALAVAAQVGGFPPRAPFGSIGRTIAASQTEHDAFGEALARVRELSGGFVPPPGATPSLRALYATLAALEADLAEHVHLETNVIFPRARDIEDRAAISALRLH